MTAHAEELAHTQLEHHQHRLGHDVAAMKDPGFQTLMIRCVEWAARGEVHHQVPPELQKGKDGK